MDLIVSHPKISKFLENYHSEDWVEVLIAAILNGIPLTNINPSSLASSKQSSLPGLRQQLNLMKEELQKLNKSLDDTKITVKTPQKRPPELRAGRKQEGRVEETPRFQKVSPIKKSVSPIRQKATLKQSPARGRSSNSWRASKPPKKPRFIPKYLQNVDSKIKDDVQKDIAYFRSLVDSTQNESIGKGSLNVMDFTEKEPSKINQSEQIESKSNSFSMNSDARLLNTLEGTFTKQNIPHKSQSSAEIPIDRDFETPRYPIEYPKDCADSEILEIAENFLAGSLMAELCSIENSSERQRCIKSQQVPPLDLLSSDENIMPFRQRWEEAAKDLEKKWEGEGKSKDYRKNTTSREFYSGRSSAMMMVQTPSPIPYDDKLGPMCQDASYSKYF